MKPIVTSAFGALLLLSASHAMAQNTVKTTWRCAKPLAMHSLAVGDVPNHSFTIIQGNCKSTASHPRFMEDESTYTEFQEMSGTSMSVHGRMNVTMQDGDKVYYSYEGSFPTDIAKPFTQRWRFEAGTGRYKSIRGTGDCSGKVHSDGTGEMECVGTFSIRSNTRE